MRAHPDDAAEVVAPEEAVQAVLGAHAEELWRGIVDDPVERARIAELRVHGIAGGGVPADAQRRAKRVHRVGGAGRLRPFDARRRLPDVGGRPALEVLQVLGEGVKVEVGVSVDRVVLVLPLIGEDPAVHVAQVCGAARAGLDRVVERIEGAVGRVDADHEPLGRVPGGHRRVLGRHRSRGNLHAGRELPRGCVRGDRRPHLPRGGGQVDLACDLEFTAHDLGSSFAVCGPLGPLVIVG